MTQSNGQDLSQHRTEEYFENDDEFGILSENMDLQEETYTDPIDTGTDTTPLGTDQVNEHHNNKGEPSKESGDSQVPPPNEQTEEHDLPRLEEVFSTYVSTIIYVPKAARNDWARLLSDELASTNTNISSVQQWVKLMMLPKSILQASNILNNQREGKTQAEVVKDRIKRWRKGEKTLLWNEAKKPKKLKGRKRKGQQQNEKTQEEVNARRCKKLLEEGQYNRASSALVSEGIVDSNPETIAIMKAKHPQAEIQPMEVGENVEPLKLSASQVRESIKSFKKGSAPGPSGMRAEHLKVAVEMGSPGRKEKTIESITNLVNNLLAGNMPKEVASYFCGANLFGAKKKDGGIRPIAVGEILRRLVSKAAMRVLSKKAEQLLSPLQLGIGVRGVCETVVHALREATKDNNSFVVQVDFRNAFNHFPEPAHWVSTC